MEFVLFTERACRRRDWETVRKCLRLADKLLRDGNSEIKNAVYVSYLESLPRGRVHERLLNMMPRDLRKGWDDIMDYMSKVAGDLEGAQATESALIPTCPSCAFTRQFVSIWRLRPIHQIRANHFAKFANATELATGVKSKCIARKKQSAMTKGNRTLRRLRSKKRSVMTIASIVKSAK